MDGTQRSLERIDEVIRRRISPLLALDHAVLEIVVFDEKQGALQVRFGGRYQGAPCRETVFGYVVAPILKQEIPSLRFIEWVD